MIIKDKVSAKPKIELGNLHGHVCIDLHNHNSGFTERIEADNMVTNALNLVMPDCLKMGNYFFPIASKALGGLMLFDDELTENVNNVCFPSEAHLVGYAAQDTDTTSNYKGSINVAESGYVENGYKTVWDFSTAQANGVIQSLSRTNAEIGTTGPTSSQYYVNRDVRNTDIRGYITPNTTVPAKVIAVDEENHEIYFIVSTNSCKVYKMPYFRNDIDVTFGFYSFDVGRDHIELVMDNETPNNTNPYSLSSRISGGYVYVFTSISSSSVSYYTIKTSDYSFDVGEIQTISGVAGHSNAPFWVENGYLYLSKSGLGGFYKVNLQNATDVSSVDLPSGYKLPTWHTDLNPMVSGVQSLFVVSTTTTSEKVFPCVLYPDNRFIVIDKDITSFDYNYRAAVAESRTYYDGLSSLYVYNYNDYVNITQGVLLNYLGTIANIQPVTKTAAQSMKITYTLTNETE